MLDVLRKKERRLPDSQLKRTYQNDLRAIGRHADDAGYWNIGVYEVPAGYIVRAFTDHNNPDSIEAIEVPDDDVKDLIMRNFTARGREAEQIKRPLCPTGYEDFLRSLGFELEEHSAKSVAIQELVGCFVVSYQQLSTTQESYIWEPREWILDAAQIQELLDAGFRRRGNAA